MSFDFHGQRIQVNGPAKILEALRSRLGGLHPSAASSADLFFSFVLTRDACHPQAARPFGHYRHFYAPSEGEALYFSDQDLLYLNDRDRACVLCSPSEGKCTVSILEPEHQQRWLATHPLFTLPLLEMLKRKRLYAVHAAALGLGESCVLFAGTSGAGKSTLTITLLRAGFSYLGDDMNFLRRDEVISVLGFPEKIDVTPNTTNFFDELHSLQNRQRSEGWPKYEVDAESQLGAPVVLQSKLRAIVLPQIAEDGVSRLHAISSDEVFIQLASNVLLTHPASTRDHCAILAEACHSVPGYRLFAGRDFSATARLVKEIFD